MNLRVQYALWFVNVVETTVRKLTENQQIGWHPYPRDPDLAGVNPILLEPLFQRHILYFRFTDEELIIERLIHGARDLPRRLRESPFGTD